jgi:hypothetical protein
MFKIAKYKKSQKYEWKLGRKMQALPKVLKNTTQNEISQKILCNNTNCDLKCDQSNAVDCV